MHIPERLKTYTDLIKKYPYLSGLGFFMALMVVAVAVAWVVAPGLGDRSKKAYAEAVSSFGKDPGQVTPLPTGIVEPVPSDDLKNQVKQLSDRLDDLEVSQINQDTALAEAEKGLNESISNLVGITESLDERQAEWLATLKRVSATTGISTSATNAAKPTATPGAADSLPGKINVNTASLSELDGLPGIGETIAQRIIDYRSKSGPFVSIEDLKEVSGIGDSVFAKIQDSVTV